MKINIFLFTQPTISWLVKCACVIVLAGLMTTAHAADWYVKAAAKSGGNGFKNKPFNSLGDAEAASGPGDTIYIRQSPSHTLLDGSIVLKPDQKLIGLGPDVTIASVNAAAARVTNSAGGTIVTLSSGNEISGIHFQPTSGSSIVSGIANYSNANIHHNLFSELPGSTPFAWNILFLTFFGDVDSVNINNNVFRDCAFMGSIQVVHFGNSTGDYNFQGNTFADIQESSYALVSLDTSSINATIKDSTSINIGVGDWNADSIVLALIGASTMNVLVDNYHYDNPEQVGNNLNTGLEAFLSPDTPPIFMPSNGSELTLEIVNSSFANSVADSIQLLNLGSNNIMDVTIRNTQVINANPQDSKLFFGHGGAISFVSEYSGLLFGIGQVSNSGNQSSLLIENSDIIGSTDYGVVLLDQGDDGFTATIDMGGGALGSVGQNRILDNVSGDIVIENLDAIGGLNWWGEDAPQIIEIGGATFNEEPVLLTDPRP